MTKGQKAYEADIKRNPFYHDGTRRRSWDDLSDIARWSWNKAPTPLPAAPVDTGGN